MIDNLETDVEMVARHLRVFEAVRENEPIGILALSEALDLPRHKVRYSLRALETEEVIIPTAKGAETTDAADDVVAQIDDQLSELGVRVCDLAEREEAER